MHSASPLAKSACAFSPALPKSALPLAAYLPPQPHKPSVPKSCPLPKPVPRDAAFYARYPSVEQQVSPASAAEVSSQVTSAGAPRPKDTQVVKWKPPAPKSGSGFVSNRAGHQERSAVVLRLFLQVCVIFRPLSRILASIEGSLHVAQFQARLLDKVADTAALRYLRSVLLLVQTVDDLGGALQSLSDAVAADVLHRAGEGPLGHPSNVLKAIRWLARRIEPEPFPNLWSSLFVFSGSGSTERKESIPLPCGFVAWVEMCLHAGYMGS